MFVEVNEALVFATRASAAWWAEYRMHGPESRFRVLTASIGGDRVAIACSDAAHAEWLAGHLVDHGGLPKSAVRVRRRRGD